MLLLQFYSYQAPSLLSHACKLVHGEVAAQTALCILLLEADGYWQTGVHNIRSISTLISDQESIQALFHKYRACFVFMD